MDNEDAQFKVLDGKHVAGEMTGLVQRCVHCGGIIMDYRNTVCPEGTPPVTGFAVGGVVTVTHNGCAFAAYDDPEWLFCNEGD